MKSVQVLYSINIISTLILRSSIISTLLQRERGAGRPGPDSYNSRAANYLRGVLVLSAVTSAISLIPDY